jgi:hypothetical protein
VCPTFAKAYVGRKRRATRISCHGAPPTSACAAFIKESRMEFANANKVYRKSGGSPSTALSESPKSPLGGLMAHRALKAHTSTPVKGKQTTAWGFRRFQRTFFGEITRLISSEPSFRTHPARIPDHSACARQSRTTAAEPNPGEPPGKAQAWPECRDRAVAGQTTRWWSRR